MTHVERLHVHGILRRRSRRGFRYVYARTGRAVKGADAARIRALRLPPRWQDVAISCAAQGRLQAVGRDRAGRWQYVYHARHVRHREAEKFRRLLRFGASLPQLRRAMARDLRSRDLTRDKVLATIVRIVAKTLIRPGSEVYAADNGSYGIATLRRKHVRVVGADVHFDFAAKSGKRQQQTLHDARAARVMRRLLQLPGYEVFKFCDADGRLRDIRRADITEYIKRHMGDAFTAKDFRTWMATLICAAALARAPSASKRDTRLRRAAARAAIKETAQQLGNTPAICRASYISPSVVDAFDQGQSLDRGAIAPSVRGHTGHSVASAERALLRLLRRYRPAGVFRR